MGVLESFKILDKNRINLLKSMGASRSDIYKFIKLPSSMGKFFAALNFSFILCSRSVISEWLGGFKFLAIYDKGKKAYAFDKMFAVIIIISILSLLLRRWIFWRRYPCHGRMKK